MSINSLLDITKSVDDLIYLESKGLDTSELLEYFTSDAPKKDCKNCYNYFPGGSHDHRNCSVKDNGFSKNRHGICPEYKEVFSICHQKKLDKYGSSYDWHPMCTESGCSNVCNDDGSININLTNELAEARQKNIEKALNNPIEKQKSKMRKWFR